ncbi:hypothetical protein [Heyndrickxia oleronia]|uniref:Uncharacterized protein n=1 Tax=Heyndrickxia oleronia TaxID=38875 RepID=A0AAW6SS96_9BACI|nr:hypothetical protein [Heyndrickxia oleronia]MDH5159839.1 hypothetical protein [Heyndrickxia oleronia]
MSESVEVKVPVSQSLVQEIKENIEHFDYKMRKSFDEETDLKERIELLELALSKTSEETVKFLIREMIEEAKLKCQEHAKCAQSAKNNKEYYQEMLKALDEALKIHKQ